jgi:voltage-gated potassium channel
MIKRRIYNVIEGEPRSDRLGRVFDAFLLVVIAASVGGALLSTDLELRGRYDDLLALIEVAAGIIFAVEFLLRLWVCTEDRRNRYTHPVHGRLRYLLSPMAVIDLLSALPLLIIIHPTISMEQLWFLRVVRILKLLRYSSALETLGLVISNERRPLIASGGIMVTLLVFLSSLMYLVEREAQPQHFGSVPQSMWWGIVTLATVGYGDAVPITPLGRVIGGFAVVLGMGMFALPAGILANGFAEEMRRRNFVVTWNLVASVPFFEHLPAARIAEIAAILQSQVAVPGESVVRQGDQADCMYFIVSGSVAVKLISGDVYLHAGDYFGEIALLTDQPRSATVIATNTCQLLVLRVNDFRHLMEAHADLRETISQVALERQAGVLPFQPTAAS